MILRLVDSLIYLLVFQLASAFNLPGASPKDYSRGEKVLLNTNSVAPRRSGRLRLSIDYYDKRFNFCKPKEGIEQKEGNLGSLLFGDRIYNTPFEFNMLEDVECAQLCTSHYSKKQLQYLSARGEGLAYFWNIDDLPLTFKLVKNSRTVVDDDEEEEEEDDDDDDKDDYFNEPRIYYYLPGIPITAFTFSPERGPSAAFNNHFDFEVEYHEFAPGQYRVVGGTVSTQSRNYTEDGAAKCAAKTKPYILPAVRGRERGRKKAVKADDIHFTYSVKWKESPVSWASRWDKYLETHGSRIHWKPLIISSVVFLVFCIVFSGLGKYFISKDIIKHVNKDSWKQLKGNCFSSPKNTLLLSVLIGNGCHLCFLTFATIIVAALGIVSPTQRGSIATSAIYAYSFSSIIGGFVSSYCFKWFKGDDNVPYDEENENTIVKTDLTLWTTLFLLTPTLIPGLVFGTFLLLNFLVVFQGSSGAVPFIVILKLIGLWFFISIPLSFVGSFIGKRKRFDYISLEDSPGESSVVTPVKEIPRLPFYLKRPIRNLLAGIIPFVSISVEISFLITSLWLHKIYFMFGFLFISYIIMLVASVIITIEIVYVMLLNGDYRWQWSSFTLSGSVGIYVFLTSVGLLLFRYSYGGLTAIILYLTYSFLISAVVYLISGSIGFLSTWIFINNIYSDIRIE